MSQERNQSASAWVFGSIRDDIMSGKIRPRARLRELHLARQLGVSQSTVREALFHLEHSGLVVRVPHCGTTVASFSQDELQERVDVRLVLEEVAFVKASQNDLRQLVEDLDTILSTALNTEEGFEHSQSELAFHRRVWREANNETLYRTLQDLTAPLFAFAGMVATREGRELSSFVAGHQPLVDALQGRDPSVIREAVRNHIVSLQGGFFRLNGSSSSGEKLTEAT